MDQAVNILKELSADNLKDFRRLLGAKGIPAGQIENADACKLVELIKQHFRTESERLRVIKSILEEIPRMDLLEKLQGNDAPDDQKKKSAEEITLISPTSPEVIAPQQRESVEMQPTASADERKSKHYGRNGQLRYPSLLQIVLGVVIIILATTSVIVTPHRRFLPLRIPWWSGVLFSVVGMMPLLPLKKTERYKLNLILGSNIVGLILALTSLGLSIWNGHNQPSECKDYLATFHWLILVFLVLQLFLSIWNIFVISFWLKKEKKARSSPHP